MSKRGDWGDKTIVVLHSKDERRHRKWCEHYRKEDGQCCKTFSKCGGSAHCKNYKVVHFANDYKPPQPQKKTEEACQTNYKRPFSGIQLIAMADIIMPMNKFYPPSPAKVAELQGYYQEYGTLDRPVIVSCFGEKYRLEDQYLQYCVAKKIGLKEIPAKIGTKQEMQLEDAIRKKGARLIHKSYGEVVVESSTLRHAVVINTDGKRITLDIETCVNNKLLTKVN